VGKKVTEGLAEGKGGKRVVKGPPIYFSLQIKKEKSRDGDLTKINERTSRGGRKRV